MSSLQLKKNAHRHFKSKSLLLITEIDFPVEKSVATIHL